MSKINRARSTLGFKMGAVRLTQSGQSIAAVAKTPGIAEQTRHNWSRRRRKAGFRRPASQSALNRGKSAACEPSWRARRWSATF
jgi:transposase-like protein